MPDRNYTLNRNSTGFRTGKASELCFEDTDESRQQSAAHLLRVDPCPFSEGVPERFDQWFIPLVPLLKKRDQLCFRCSIHDIPLIR
jgi:hypothetical protein